MSASSPNPKPPNISQSLARALEQATAAIAHLDARVSATSVAIGWYHRAAWSGYARALQLQGVEIDEIDVFSWGCGLPLPSRPRRPSHTNEYAAFALWRAEIDASDGPNWRDRLPFTPQIPRDRPRLLIALELCHAYARRDGSAAAWLALPIILRGLGVTRASLPCLVSGAKAFRWRAALSEEIALPVIRSLTSAAELGLERLNAMEGDRRRGIAALRTEFRPTALVKLLALIAVHPILSPKSASSALALTLGGAGKLLGRASELKLLVEITGRRAWRLYLTPDLAVTFGFTSAIRGRPSRARIESTQDNSMTDALDAFDREMAEIEHRLAKSAEGMHGQRDALPARAIDFKSCPAP